MPGNAVPHELKDLGGWKSNSTVDCYAKLANGTPRGCYVSLTKRPPRRYVLPRGADGPLPDRLRPVGSRASEGWIAYPSVGGSTARKTTAQSGSQRAGLRRPEPR